MFNSLTPQTPAISKMATSARDIRVAVRGGDIFPCRPEFTVDDAVAGIREGYSLSGGYIRDQRGAMRGTDVIGDAVGDLTFVGGRDLPPSQTAPATATAQPAGISQILTR
jgi:hypothetical protein